MTPSLHSPIWTPVVLLLALVFSAWSITLILSVNPIFDDEGQYAGALGMITDITERKRAEEEWLKLSKLESLGLLAGGIAHDFNNLLTAILGNLSLARLSPSLTQPLATRLNEAEKACLRAKV